MSSLPYSYHTFLFPFIWKINSRVKRVEFDKILLIGEKWIECKWEELIKTEKHQTEFDDWFQNYQAYQYFTDAANNMIFNSKKNGVVKCYEYHKKGGSYIIIKDEKVYSLKINRIRLNVYDAGIAVLIFEMENLVHRALNEVNAINEYGRRINFPYLVEPSIDKKTQNKKVSHALCADKIVIGFNDGEVFSEDYKKTLMNIQDFIHNNKISFSFVMKPIQDILDGGKNKITANEAHAENDKFYIKPCVDDRMFVCCMVMDEKLSRELQGIDKDKISFLTDCDKRIYKDKNGKCIDSAGKKHDDYMEGWSDEETLSSRLYKLLYIETDLTCQDNQMKKELLASSVYKRWINKGTIYGVTHHSLVAVNSGATGIINSVINPFLIEYVQMAILVLAQRSVILMLENEAATVSNTFHDDMDITQDKIKEIEWLQAKYVKLQNQLLLSEVTVQEQGVEIYEMLCQQLYILQNKKELDEQMNNLRDVANISNERLERESDKRKAKHDEAMIKIERERELKQQELEKAEEKRFTILALILGVISICEPLAMLMNDDGRAANAVWFALSVFFIIVAFVYYKKSKNKNKSD